MKRQDKYPNHEHFTYYNHNPKNRITGDCLVRSISFALNIPYNQVVMDAANFQCDTGYDGNYSESIFIEKTYGIKNQPQLKHDDNTKYTVKEFINKFPKGTYILRMPSHMTVIKDGKNYDIWDCTKSTSKVGKWWIIK